MIPIYTTILYQKNFEESMGIRQFKKDIYVRQGNFYTIN